MHPLILRPRALFYRTDCTRRSKFLTHALECELNQDESETQTIESTKSEKLHEKLSKLCLQDELSDVEIICDGKIFKCHKMILCAQSDAFEGKVLFFYLLNTNLTKKLLPKSLHCTVEPRISIRITD